MPGRSSWMSNFAFVWAALAGLALSADAKAQGQAPKYLGADSCLNCHSTPEKNGFSHAKDHIRLDEYAIWKNKDKHSLAFANLSSERGASMAKRLNQDVTKAEAGCLGCHSAGVVDKALQGVNFNLAEGVSCESCHGPAENWLAPHLDDKRWRNYSSAEKETYGMNDLAAPTRQAAKCLSCHIGNSGEGKVVTHEMYAAGHPPLPSIEVAAFSKQMPLHWFPKKNKPENKEKVAAGEFLFDRSKLAMVSSGVALKTALSLIADESKLTETPTVPGLVWPDYARFDCASCHHELERPAWRQARGFGGKAPGRPPVSTWSLYLSSLGVKSVIKEAEIGKKIESADEAFVDAIRAQPFGRRDLGTHATKYSAQADEIIAKLNAAKYDAKSVGGLLKELVEEASKKDLDYDVARHVGWTIWTFHEDLGPDPKNEAEIKVILDRIATGLRLTLPAGHKDKIEDQLEASLSAMGNYKPAALQEDLKALGALLSY